MKALGIACLFLLSGLTAAVDWDVTTPLDDYIAKEEPLYEYSIAQVFNYTETHDVIVYMVNFTSQQWTNDSFVDRYVWWHMMAVTIPNNVRFRDAAFVYVKGGRNNDYTIPDPENDPEMNLIRNMSREVGVIGCVLRQVPNQPLFFRDDPSGRGRTEDDAIAYTWRRYRETRDPNILLQLPMTKAVVKAFDTVANVANDIDISFNIRRFMVAGGSKRGWASWTAASVDRRVIGAGPIVLSCLNFVQNLHHHYRSLGGYTWVFKDYYNENLTYYLDDPVTQEMLNIVEPYEYRERLTMPKMQMIATGDEFFMPDDSHYYYHNMEQPMYLVVTENTHHGMTGAYIRMLDTLSTFFLAVLTNHKMPELSWDRNETATGGSVTLYTDTTPSYVMGWGALSNQNYTTRRDWRWSNTEGFQPVFWDEKEVEQIGEGTYRVEYDKPAEGEGWQAFFINVRFPGPEEGFEYDFTTEVNIIPDNFYYDDCSGLDCYGTLV